MCEKLGRCSVSSVEDTLGVLWGWGGVVCAVCVVGRFVSTKNTV
jgi:hypothetical protein